MSIVADEHGRTPVGLASTSAELAALVVECQRRIEAGDHPGANFRRGAMLIQRADQTAEARRAHWESEFYDVDRAGRRRRRYRRPAIEVEWEAWQKRERAEARAARQISNAGRG